MSFPSLPTPPTDNLYKFMAISGLVAAILAIVFYHGFVMNTGLKVQEASAEISIVSAVIDNLKRQSALFRKRMELSNGENLAELLQEATLLEDELLELQIQHHRSIQKHEESKLFANLFYPLMIAVLVISVGGISVSISGFQLWYSRLQRYQDGILRQRASQNAEEPHQTDTGS